MEIDAVHTQPQIAAENANAVAAGFVSYVEGIRESQFIAARTELPNQLAELGEFALVGEVAESLGSTLENLLSSLSGVTLVTPAETPADSLPAPANHTVRNTAMALIAGILLSIPLVLILDYFRNPIGSAAMFQRRFGLSHLGTVPRWSKGIRGAGVLAVSSGADRETAEAIRQAAANVEFGARAWGINSIVMASPDKGEGQSSLMANLAVAISSRWKRVVVVDADLRHSSLHGYFGLGNQVGLASLLADPDLDVGNVIQDTKYDGLQVITGGDVPADPVALLKSPRMAGLIKRLESDYDLVLVDTPPMAALADGAVIASQVGAAIMVVNPTNAHIAGVKLALGNLEKANTRVLGFIWNRVARGSVARYVRYERESRSRGGTHAPGQLAPNSND